MPKRVEHPIILGIVGDSASGKTTLSAGVAQILGEDRCTVLCTDDYHRLDRRERAEKGLSAIDPRANYLDILEQALRHLREGDPILKPVYDHRDGTFGWPKYVKPNEFVIAEGLLGYTTRGMRDCYDVKIYLDPDEDVRVKWKIHRDTTRRGYRREEVLASLEKRREDAPKYMHPQRTFADIVIHFQKPRTAPTRSLTLDTSCARLCRIPTSRRCSTARAMRGCGSSSPATATASRWTCWKSTAISPTSVPNASKICYGTSSRRRGICATRSDASMSPTALPGAIRLR